MKGRPREVSDVVTRRSAFKLKPFQFPDDFCLVQDTREQASPLMDRLPPGLVIMSKPLKYGDFSIKGFEEKFCIERKQISDLLTYVTTERESKTIRKMREFSLMDWVGLAVEVPKPADLYKPYPYSRVNPEVVRQSLVSFAVRYGVHVFVGNSTDVVRFILDHAIKWYNIHREV